MKRRPRIYYTETDKALMWDRWQKGESLNSIARHFDRHHSAIALLYTALLPILFQQLMGLADSIKIIISVFLIAAVVLLALGLYVAAAAIIRKQPP